MRNNSFEFRGALGKDVEVITMESGNLLAKFDIATDTSYKDHDGVFIKRTEWFTINCWNRIAERAEEGLKTGDRVIVRGIVTNREYTNKDGIKVRTVDFTALELIALK